MLRIYDLNVSRVPRSEVQEWLEQPEVLTYPTSITHPENYKTIVGIFFPDTRPNSTSRNLVSFRGTFSTPESSYDANLEINNPRQSRVAKIIGCLVGRDPEEQGNAMVYLGIFWDKDDGNPNITVKENY